MGVDINITGPEGEPLGHWKRDDQGNLVDEDKERYKKALETIVAFGHAYIHAEDMYEVAREALDG